MLVGGRTVIWTTALGLQRHCSRPFTALPDLSQHRARCRGEGSLFNSEQTEWEKDCTNFPRGIIIAIPGPGLKILSTGTSLVVQWLGLCASTAEGMASIPGLGTKIPHAVRCSRKKKKIQLKKILSIENQISIWFISVPYAGSSQCPPYGGVVQARTWLEQDPRGFSSSCLTRASQSLKKPIIYVVKLGGSVLTGSSRVKPSLLVVYFFFIHLFILLFYFVDCVGSSLLRAGFL